MRTCKVSLCEYFKQNGKEAFLHDKHCVIHKMFNKPFFVLALSLAIYKYTYVISLYKARKLMKANKAFFKDYLGDARN